PLGRAYMGLLTFVEKKAGQLKGTRPWAIPAIGGTLVGIIALWLPEVRGTGQVTIQQALEGTSWGWRSGPIAMAKVLASALTLGTGGSGGTLMPAMFIGAAGGDFWGVTLSFLGFHSVP